MVGATSSEGFLVKIPTRNSEVVGTRVMIAEIFTIFWTIAAHPISVIRLLMQSSIKKSYTRNY